jgi:hypothetical protein
LDKKEHLIKVKAIHKEDLKNGFGTVYLLYAIEKKYPNAKYEWIEQEYYMTNFVGFIDLIRSHKLMLGVQR